MAEETKCVERSRTAVKYIRFAPALFSVRISTVFRHWVRAFLLLSITLCVHFYCISIAFGLLWTACGLLSFSEDSIKKLSK